MRTQEVKGNSAFFWIILIVLIATACRKDPYRPGKFLSADKQANLIRQTVHYSTKLPPNSSKEKRFEKEFDWYYDLAAKETKLIKYYADGDEAGYFLMSRVARSITPMREGIGGKVTLDQSGKILKYEEVFRTWKMVEDSLTVRAAMLFDRMVKGKDLTLFYSKFQGDKFIEFPDGRFYFDKETMGWKDSDSLRMQ